nr:immunoglobulin heavy chain junction region [Mus musculus]
YYCARSNWDNWFFD